MGIQGLKSCCNAIRGLFNDIFIVTRKNLRIRRRRYMGFLMEILTPVLITVIIVTANTLKSVFRIESLEFSTQENELEINDTLEGFYDLGNHFDESLIQSYSLCSHHDDGPYCQIGYIADEETKLKIFDPDRLKTVFSNTTKFIEFDDEQEIDECLKKADVCEKLTEAFTSFNGDENEDPVLGFRGVIVFDTGINSPQVKYKIRLMETYFGSLRHVLKTSILYPSLYDRREYALSYLKTGFLAVQLSIDKLIIEAIKEQTDSPKAADIIINSTSERHNTECTCEVVMHEIPHRQSDKFSDADDPLDLEPDYETDSHAIEEDESSFLTLDEHEAEQASKVNKNSLIISTVLVLSFTFLLPSEQRRIASEKENGLTILLLVTGMTHRMQWFGNLLAITILYICTITIVVVLLTVKFNKTEGAVFEFVSGPVLWLLFFLYVMALASACYFSTVFFDKPMSAIAATLCFWVSTFVAPVYHIDYYYDIVPIYVTLLACLHPSIALQMAFRLLIRFERHKVSTSIFALTRFIPTDPLRIIYMVIILIVDAIIYMVLAIYLDRILKPRYGVTKPWYYIFMASEYSSSGSKVAPSIMVQSTAEQPGYEACPSTAEPSVSTDNLTKKYGKKVAIENLNIQLYHGEIFALLGPNGSGKSTVLNLFSGFTPPTSGTATVFGYDIKTHMVQIQAFTGMCPQQSWLYDDLTPYEHLMIFGRLRGLLSDDAKEESIELLEKLHIHETAHWFTRNLSKGEQRKLSLAIALIGNPKVVLLDEPTGGLDYYSRRVVWDLLLKIRSNHTILFTTHFMDEAELLGDRIGILASGKMHVCGSHFFLRKHFGLGYSLRIKMDPDRELDSQEILQVVTGAIPNATLSTLPISPNSNRLFTFNLPSEGYSSAILSLLFTELARVKEALGIVGFSVSYSTIDEIFLELMRQLNPTKETVAQVENDDYYHEENREENVKKLSTPKRKLLLPLIHFFVLLQKKMRYTFRNPRLFIFHIILPLLVFTIGILRLSSHVNVREGDAKPLELTLDGYENIITLYHATEDTFIQPNTLKAVIGQSATFTRNPDLSGDYIHVDYTKLRNKHFVGISTETGSKSEMYVHFSPYTLHSAPVALSLFSNSLVKYMDESRRIVTINHPLHHPYFSGAIFEEDPYAPDIFSMMSTLSVSTSVAFCVLFPLQERVTQTKHLQLMTGVHPLLYWGSIFVWDLLVILVECILLICFSILYEPLIVFSVSKKYMPLGIAVLWLSFIYSGLQMSYCVSQFARSKSGGFSLLMSINLLFGIIVPFFVFGVGYKETNLSPKFHWFLLLLPVYAFASAQRKFAITLLGNGRCKHFTEIGQLRYCDTTKTVGLRRVSCCETCAEIPDARGCYDRGEFTRLPWSKFYHSFDEGTDNHPDRHDFKSTTRSIFYEVLYMLLVGLVFNFVTVFLDTDACKVLYSCITGVRGRAFQTNVEDDDVLDLDYT